MIRLRVLRATIRKKYILIGKVVDGCTISNLSNISNTRDIVSSTYLNTEKRVENTTCSEVFLTKFEVFG